MEYNISARKTNEELKERLQTAAKRADCALNSLLESDSSKDGVRRAVSEYVRIRYLLEPEDMVSDALNYLGEASLSRGLGIPVEQVRKSELDSKCENTSSSMTKKILLVIALNKALGIDIDSTRTADIVTLSELCDEVFMLLERKSASGWAANEGTGDDSGR